MLYIPSVYPKTAISTSACFCKLPVEQLTSHCLLYSMVIQASGEQQTEWSIAQVPW